MFLIRSIAQAKGGKRDEAVGAMKEWAAEANKAVGFPTQRILTASVGPADSTVVMESEIASLGEFQSKLDAMNSWAGMQKWGPKFGEYFIEGTHRFEIYRIC